MDEADMAVAGFACTYERSKVVLCPPAVQYSPYYFFTRYPLEKTKVWNLLNLLSPTSWIWTFSATMSIVIVLKSFTIVGIHMQCYTSMQNITLVPIR